MKYARLGVLFLVEPRGVHLVIVGDALVELASLLGGDLLDELGRHTSPEGVGLDATIAPSPTTTSSITTDPMPMRA